MEIGQILTVSTGEAYIYGLFDSADPQQIIRYVGQTAHPYQRLMSHWTQGNIYTYIGNSPLGQWLQSLLNADSRPSLIILATVTKADARQAEQEWIDKIHKETGMLINFDLGFRRRWGVPTSKIKAPRNTTFLQHIRSERNLTQKQLAKMLGLDESHICMLEKGRRGFTDRIISKLSKLEITFPE